MKLLIISNMAHYYRDGQIVGHGPTVTEINHLVSLFDTIIHVGCLHTTPAPDLALPYTSDNIHLIPLKPTGGPTWIDKIKIVIQIPVYLWVILRQLPHADVLHLRAPANIPLIAMLLLPFFRKPEHRWIKYAGNWQPKGRDNRSYRFQRWWLKRGWHRSTVTVNGVWPDSPSFVRSFINPCLTEEQLTEGERIAAQKQLQVPLRFIFAGRVEAIKGMGRILEIASQLHQLGIPYDIDIVGDGPSRNMYENEVRDRGIADHFHFHSWLSRVQLDTLYAKAHFILFPSSSSEGWPKVLSEAMAFGAVALTSDVSSIPQIIQHSGAGKSFPADDTDRFVQAIQAYLAKPDDWRRDSQNALALAKHFSYDRYLNDVRNLLDQSY